MSWTQLIELTPLCNVESVVELAIVENLDKERRDTKLNTLGRCETDCLDELLLIAMNVLNTGHAVFKAG